MHIREVAMHRNRKRHGRHHEKDLSFADMNFVYMKRGSGKRSKMKENRRN